MAQAIRTNLWPMQHPCISLCDVVPALGQPCICPAPFSPIQHKKVLYMYHPDFDAFGRETFYRYPSRAQRRRSHKTRSIVPSYNCFDCLPAPKLLWIYSIKNAPCISHGAFSIRLYASAVTALPAQNVPRRPDADIAQSIHGHTDIRIRASVLPIHVQAPVATIH